MGVLVGFYGARAEADPKSFPFPASRADPNFGHFSHGYSFMGRRGGEMWGKSPEIPSGCYKVRGSGVILVILC